MDNYIENYYNNPAISQSQLKLLLGNNPKIFLEEKEDKLYYEEKTSFIIGSAVDTIITQGLYEFKKKFYITRLLNKPSATIMSIIKEVFDSLSEEDKSNPLSSLKEYKNKILEVCDYHNYSMNLKEDTRINKILEHSSYFDELLYSRDKIILSSEEFNVIMRVVQAFQDCEYTAKYLQDKENELIFQKDCYFTLEGVDCKALIDLIIVNKKEKTVQPIDIKTTGSDTLDFFKTYIMFRYDIQAVMYSKALEILYPDYTILPFKFLVASTGEDPSPLVFTCSKEVLEEGWKGSTQFKKKGLLQLLEDYKYYSTYGFNIKREIVEKQGEFTLEV